MTASQQRWWKYVVAVVGGPLLLELVARVFGISNSPISTPVSLADASLIVALFLPALLASWFSVTWPGRHLPAYTLMGLLTGLLYLPRLGTYIVVDGRNAWQSWSAALLLLWFYLILFLTGGLAGDAIKFILQYRLSVNRKSTPRTDAPVAPSVGRAGKASPQEKLGTSADVDKTLSRLAQIATILAPIFALIVAVITGHFTIKAAQISAHH